MSSKVLILLTLGAVMVAGAAAAAPPVLLPMVPDNTQARLQAQLVAQQARAQASLAAQQARVQAQLDANQARLEGQVAAQEAGARAQAAAASQRTATAAEMAALAPALAEPLRAPAAGPVGTMELTTLTPRLGRYFGTDHGVLVVRAPMQGVLKLQDGDVILSIGGRVPASSSQAMRILTSYDPGQKIRLVILRDHQRTEITATMPALPGEP